MLPVVRLSTGDLSSRLWVVVDVVCRRGLRWLDDVPHRPTRPPERIEAFDVSAAFKNFSMSAPLALIFNFTRFVKDMDAPLSCYVTAALRAFFCRPFFGGQVEVAIKAISVETQKCNASAPATGERRLTSRSVVVVVGF